MTYNREILFYVESQAFEKAKSLKSSEDKFNPMNCDETFLREFEGIPVEV